MFTDLKKAGGNANNSGAVDITGVLEADLIQSNLAVGSEVTLVDQQGQDGSAMNHAINVGGANLNLSQGGVFNQTVAASAITIGGISRFMENVTGAVTTNAATVFEKNVGGNATVNADTVFKGQVTGGGGVTVNAGRRATFTQTANFTTVANSGTVDLSPYNTNIATQFADVNNAGANSIVNVIADAGNASISSALTNSTPGVFNFGSKGASVLTIEKPVNIFPSGNFHVSEGIVNLKTTEGSNAPAIKADTFTIDRGAELRYANTGPDRSEEIHADSHLSHGAINVGAGNTLVFKDLTGVTTNKLTLADGSVVTLQSDANGDKGLIKASEVRSLSGISVGTVTLKLEGPASNWLGMGMKDLFGTVAETDVEAAMFELGRFVYGSNGITRQAIARAFPSLTTNRNMIAAASYLDGVQAHWDATGVTANSLDRFFDQIETYINNGQYGAARSAFGALAGEHLMYSGMGMQTVNGQFWNAIDMRRDAAIDLNLAIAPVARRNGAGSSSAYGDLVPPNCYPVRRGRTVRDRNGGYSFAGGNSAIWADYIGAWAKRNGDSRIDGYKVTSNGVALGYEYRLGQFTFGAALGYARAHTKVSDYSLNTKTDSFNMALYADYNHAGGFFARAGLGLSYGWNDYEAHGPSFNRSGKYDNAVWNIRADIGYAIRTSAVNIIPTFGVHFATRHQDGWTDKDKSAFVLNGKARGRNDYTFDLPLEVRVNKAFVFGGIVVAPEARVGVTYAAKKDRPKLNYGLQGAPGSYGVNGVDPGRARGVLGLGAKAKFGSMVDAGLDYSFEVGRRFRQHNLTASVGVSF
jgi:hypothetical protein